jgi:1,4-dihydroxy-2-naphthoate octaprenyltransferase
LPAALVPVWTGTVLAWKCGHHVELWLAFCALASAVAIQVATNFFNDALDFKKGADTAERIGPMRVTASGRLSSRAVLAMGVCALVAACLTSLPLIAVRGWPILAIGLPSLVLSFGYTGGPWPLAYRGLGEIFVLLFFGLVAVAGTVFVNTGAWHWRLSLLLGTQVGLFSTALIAINNLRDIAEDTRSGKLTLAVRLGPRFARREIVILMLFPYLIGLAWLPIWPAAAVVPLTGLPLSLFIARKVWTVAPGAIYNRYLAMAGAQLLLFAILFTIAAVAC